MIGILVFNQNYIGDVVFTIPALRSIKEGYPESFIDVVVGDAPLKLLEGNPYLNSLKPRPKNFAQMKNFLKEIKKTHYDLCFSFSSKSTELAVLSLLSRCRRRYGFFNPLTFPFFTSHLKENTNDHTAKDYLKLAMLGGGRKVPIIPEIFISEGEIHRAQERIETMLGKEKTNVFGVLLGGSTSYKRWHPNILKDLLDLLEREGKILLFGGKELKNIGEVVRMGRRNIYNLAGSLSLREAIALLKLCSVFIGHDSGLTHIAAALGVPTIGIYMVTDPKRTAPLGKRVKVIYKPPPCGPCWGKKSCKNLLCLQTISANEIMEKIEELVERE